MKKRKGRESGEKTENIDIYTLEAKIREAADEWAKINADTKPDKQGYVEIVMANTFNGERKKVADFYEGLLLEEYVPTNRALTLAQYLNRQFGPDFRIKCKTKDGVHALVAYQVRERDMVDDPCEPYINDVRSYVEENGSQAIKEIRIFCNLALVACEKSIKGLLEVLAEHNVSATYFTNYSHASIFRDLIRERDIKRLSFVISDREKHIHHFAGIVVLKANHEGHKYLIAKYDEVTGVRMRLFQEKKDEEPLRHNFVNHHLKRMARIEEGAVMDLDSYLDNGRPGAVENERHTVHLDKLSSLPTNTEIYQEILALATMKTSAQAKRIKHQRNRCLSLLNFYHVFTGTDTTLLKSIIFTIYSLHNLEKRFTEDEHESIIKIMGILSDRDFNQVIWDALRRFDNYISRGAELPYISHDQVDDMMDRIHHSKDGRVPLSSAFPEIPFPAEPLALHASISKIVRVPKLRERFGVFLEREHNIERGEAVEKMMDLLYR